MSDIDTIKRSLASVIDQRARALGIDTLAQYSGTVVSQNGDGTLEIKPDDARLAPMSSVPLRVGVPGMKILVNPGGRCSIGWYGGNVKAPYAEVNDPNTLKSIEITASQKLTVNAPEVDLVVAGGLPVARQGDMVASGGTTPAPCFIQLPPGPNSGSPVPATITFLPLPLYGLITSGNPAVKS